MVTLMMQVMGAGLRPIRTIVAMILRCLVSEGKFMFGHVFVLKLLMFCVKSHLMLS